MPPHFKQVFLVLSGKGGVGKSSVSALLALYLAQKDEKVGIIDADLCGPSIPKMFGLSSAKVHQGSSGWTPVSFSYGNGNSISVMSLAFLMANQENAIIWRGPKKNAMIKQFFQSVEWGNLDYLVIDTPPGTSDEHLAILEELKTVSMDHSVKAVLVTTPQLISLADVEREIVFCQEVGLEIAGLIENMAGYACPHCSNCTNIFSRGGGEQLAAKYDILILGSLPILPSLAAALESENAVDIVSILEADELKRVFTHIVTKILTNNYITTA
jgi:Mrp family chromosome partitioning ATPase